MIPLTSALGGHPYQFTPQPAVTWDGTLVSITFQRPAHIGDVIYQAEAATDLRNWDELILEVLTPGADPETVRATRIVDGSVSGVRFLRLRITR